jgi:cystathionine beta-lyase
MKERTRLVHMGRGPRIAEGTVNLPVYRASTILSPDLHSYLNRHGGERRHEKVTYGASGTHNAKALARAVADLECAAGCMVTASGLSAVTHGISAFVRAGDHLLMSDSVYGPARRFCSEVLTRFGVSCTYYDPGITPDGLDALIQDNTRMVYMEAPGSLTFEMQDIPGLAAAARERGVLTAMDNTWATPLGFKPVRHGVDISIQAGTKYIAGHSDLVIGMISTRTAEQLDQLADHVNAFGDTASPDDCFLTLRGLRTMAVRLAAQQAAAMEVAIWLAARPEVKRVMYPPLEGDPGHALYRRDFTAGASLFGLALHSTDLEATARMVDGLELFQIGSSWGGYESLIVANRMPLPRDVVPWTETPFLLRLHIGLEDPQDLIADLRAGLERLNAA